MMGDLSTRKEAPMNDQTPPTQEWIDAVARAYVAARHQKKYLERSLQELQVVLQASLRVRPGETRILADGDLKAHGVLQYRIPGIRDSGRKELERLLQRKQFWGPAFASQLSFPGLRKLLKRIEPWRQTAVARFSPIREGDPGGAAASGRLDAGLELLGTNQATVLAG